MYHRCVSGWGRGWYPPRDFWFIDPPPSRKAENLVIKPRSLLTPPQNFQGPYVVNLILYVVTEIFYDPPREKFSVHTYDSSHKLDTYYRKAISWSDAWLASLCLCVSSLYKIRWRVHLYTEKAHFPFVRRRLCASIVTGCWNIRLIKVAVTPDLTTLYYINSYMGSPKHCKVKSPTWLNTT